MIEHLYVSQWRYTIYFPLGCKFRSLDTVYINMMIMQLKQMVLVIEHLALECKLDGATKIMMLRSQP